MIWLSHIIKLNLFQRLTIAYQILKDVIWGITLGKGMRTKGYLYPVLVQDVCLEDSQKYLTIIMKKQKNHYCLKVQKKKVRSQKYLSHGQIGFILREDKECMINCR